MFSESADWHSSHPQSDLCLHVPRVAGVVAVEAPGDPLGPRSVEVGR